MSLPRTRPRGLCGTLAVRWLAELVDVGRLQVGPVPDEPEWVAPGAGLQDGVGGDLGDHGRLDLGERHGLA